MSPLGIEFGQRGQHKSSLMQAGMRDDQGRLGKNAVIIQQHVEIQGARPLAVVLIAPQRPFDLTADLQQALRGDVRLDLHHTVKEPGGTGVAPSSSGSVS